MKKDHRPQLVTKIYFDSGYVEVSSINYIQDGIYLDETCVFYPNDMSDVLGTYDDHFKIVKDLLEGYNK
jgi:hypothetical protein